MNLLSKCSVSVIDRYFKKKSIHVLIVRHIAATIVLFLNLIHINVEHVKEFLRTQLKAVNALFVFLVHIVKMFFRLIKILKLNVGFIFANFATGIQKR